MESRHNPIALTVEVAYATPSRQVVVVVHVPDGATIRQVIALSGVLTQFPEINLTHQDVGIFGEPASLDECVHDRDRVEIYRALTCDPKEARRRRARHHRGKVKL